MRVGGVNSIFIMPCVAAHHFVDSFHKESNTVFQFHGYQ